MQHKHSTTALNKLSFAQCALAATTVFKPLANALGTAIPFMNQPTADVTLPALQGGNQLENALAELNRASWVTVIDVVAHGVTDILNAKELIQTAFWNDTENASYVAMFEHLCELDVLIGFRADEVKHNKRTACLDAEIQDVIARLVAHSASEKGKLMM
jgi:hypothetical protein